MRQRFNCPVSVLAILLSAYCCAGWELSTELLTLKLKERERPYFWDPKKPDGGIISSADDDKGVWLRAVKKADTLFIYDKSERLHFSGKNVVVSDSLISGSHTVLYLEEINGPGFDFYGLLICRAVNREGAESKLLCTQQERTGQEKLRYHLNGLYSFEYPLVEMQCVVSGEKRGHERAGFWRGEIDLSKIELRAQEEREN